MQVLFAKLPLDRNGSSPRMSQLWVKKSQVLEFSQRNWIYSLKEYILDNAEKIVWIPLWTFVLCLCLANFFFTFFKIDFFWFLCIFILMYFMTSKIIFSKFGMYLTYTNRFWGHFSWFLGRDINSTVWTRNGSKIKKRVMVFKGLKEVYICWGPPFDLK